MVRQIVLGAALVALVLTNVAWKMTSDELRKCNEVTAPGLLKRAVKAELALARTSRLRSKAEGQLLKAYVASLDLCARTANASGWCMQTLGWEEPWHAEKD